MRRVIVSVAVVLLAAVEIARAADTAAAVPPVVQGRAGRGTANTNDFFYRLGPDSKPMDGVPKGKFTGPKVIPSNVFPGTRHTYWVYVPAQYDPARPTAVMVFNDGPAMCRDTMFWTT